MNVPSRFVNVRSAVALVALMAGVAALPAPAFAQAGGRGRGAAPSAPAAAAAYSPPRTPDGQPDISGLYVALTAPGPVETAIAPPTARAGGRAGGEFLFGINERAALPAGTTRRPLVVDPPDGKIPLQAWAWEKRKEIIANQDKLEFLDGRVLCIAPGLPRTQIPAPVVGYQILQKPGFVVIFYEQSHLHRVIPLDGRQKLPTSIRRAMGVSRGRWEGSTLVVEATNFTTNFPNQNWVIATASVPTGVPAESLTSGHGIPRSDEYRVVERFTPIDKNTLHYEATIHDPKVFTQPWTLSYNAMERAPADYVPVEYACHEGNARNIDLLVGVDTLRVRLTVP